MLAPALLAGCSLGSERRRRAATTSDDRSATMHLPAGRRRVDARLVGPTNDQEIVIGDSADAPRIKFFLTAGEAEAEQFQGRGEGAEQIGGTLLYVGDGSDDLLEAGREVPGRPVEAPGSQDGLRRPPGRQGEGGLE